jgi:hypothetical protein
MDIRYNLDSETGLPHIYDHGVWEQEVEEVLRQKGEVYPARGNIVRLDCCCAGIRR